MGVGTAPTESVALTPTEPRRSGAVFRRAGQLDDSAVGVARVVCRVVSLVYPFGGGTSVEREQTGSTADSGTRVSGDRGGGAVISFTILKHLFRSVSPWKSVQRRSRSSQFSVTPRCEGRVYRRADVDPTTPKRPRGGVLSPESRGVAAAGFVYMIRIYRLGGSPPAAPAPTVGVR